MNSTLKSLLFWMALVVLGVLIWNFSTKFQTHERTVTFSEFMSWADSGTVARVTITGQEIKPPDFLSQYQPDYVILMNPIYVPEVQRDLDRMSLKAKILPVGV